MYRTLASRIALATLLAFLAEAPLAAQASAAQPAAIVRVRAELEREYAKNAEAFKRWDVAGIMALRDTGFHTYPPNGQRQNRTDMEQYTIGLLNGIKKWNLLELKIDSLDLSPSGDTVIVIMSQHLDRQALRPDNQVHHVETWATQRETWVRHGTGWLLWRVDQVRNQRRLVDGVPG